MGEVNATPPSLQDLTHLEHPYDIFKDSSLRFLGYTNELGEAFRPLLPRPVVTATYGVVFLYTIADTADKCKRAYQLSLFRGEGSSMATRRAIDAGMYTGIWQTLASLLVPPFFINRVMAGTRFLLSRYSNVSSSTSRWICVSMGLLTIPVVMSPIDHAVHYGLENTFRPLSRQFICPPYAPAKVNDIEDVL